MNSCFSCIYNNLRTATGLVRSVKRLTAEGEVEGSILRVFSLNKNNYKMKTLPLPWKWLNFSLGSDDQVKWRSRLQ